MPPDVSQEDLTLLPVVMLGGTLCDRRVFGPLRERLACESAVIEDLCAPSLREAAAEVLLRAPEQFVLMGFSLGGMVAIEAALLAPGRVRGLILLSTTPLSVPPERHAGRRGLVETARAMPAREFVREWLWPEYGGAPGDTTTLPLLEEMAEAMGCEVYARQTEMALAREDLRPRLGAIACPTLIVAGDLDVVCPPAAQEALAEAMPGSRCVMLRGAGHFALLQQPDAVAAAVAAWLHTFNAAEQRGGVASTRTGSQ